MKILTFENCEFTHVNDRVQTTVVDEIHICMDTYLPLLIISYCFIYLSSYDKQEDTIILNPFFQTITVNHVKQKIDLQYLQNFWTTHSHPSPRLSIVSGATWHLQGGLFTGANYTEIAIQRLEKEAEKLFRRGAVFEMLNRTSWDDVITQRSGGWDEWKEWNFDDGSSLFYIKSGIVDSLVGTRSE